MMEILTIEQMYEHYRNEWLLIAFTEIDDDFNVLKGEVLAHSPERDDIYAAFDRREGKSVAVEYTGQVPANLGGVFDFLHDKWAELKREIAIGVEEADRGELIDGDVVFQQLRDRLEQRRNLANS